MNARYFRMLFHNTAEGVYQTLAVSDDIANEQVHFTFLAGGAAPEREECYPVDILAIGDCGKGTIAQMKKYVERHKVGMVILPFEDEAKSQELDNYLKSRKVDEVYFLSHEERLKLPVDNKAAFEEKSGAFVPWDNGQGYLGGSVVRANWLFLFAGVKGTEGPGIAVYHGTLNADKTREDCAFAVKPYTGDQPCVSCLLSEDEHCGFGCHYQKDVDVIKAHKDGTKERYCIGNLLLGAAVSEETASDLADSFRFLSGEIRTLGLAAGQKAFSPRLLDELKGKNYRYFAFPKEKVCAGNLGNISLESPYFRCVPLSREYGLCECGYFVPYLTEKSVQS